MSRKTAFSYHFKFAVSSIHPGHFILPKSAFCPLLVPKTPPKCIAQMMYSHQEEAEIYNARPNKQRFQVNKTAEKSSW